MRALLSFLVLRRVQALHRVSREQPKASHVSCIALCVPPGVSSSRCFTLRCWSPVPRVPSRCVVPPGVVSNCFGNVDSSRGARRLTGVASAIVSIGGTASIRKEDSEGEILAQVPTRNSYLTFQYLTIQLEFLLAFGFSREQELNFEHSTEGGVIKRCIPGSARHKNTCL